MPDSVRQLNFTLPQEAMDKIDILRGIGGENHSKLSKAAYILKLVEQDWTRNQDYVRLARVKALIADHHGLLDQITGLSDIGIEIAPERREAIMAGLSELEDAQTTLLNKIQPTAES